MDKQKILIELKPSTKEWLEEKADENGRAMMREAEHIIEQAKRKDTSR